MNTKTGKIITTDELNKLSEEERKNYIQLSEEQLKILAGSQPDIKLLPSKDISNVLISKKKRIEKRRRMNKLKNKNRRLHK